MIRYLVILETWLAVKGGISTEQVWLRSEEAAKKLVLEWNKLGNNYGANYFKIEEPN